MLCKYLGRLCGCDGTFLFPQANGHVSQDQEEPVYPESTARAPAEDETQVGPLLGSVPLPLFFHWCCQAVIGTLSADSEVKNQPVMIVLQFCFQGWSLVLAFQINLGSRQLLSEEL